MLFNKVFEINQHLAHKLKLWNIYHLV